MVYILEAILLDNKIISLEHKTGDPLSLQRSDLGVHFTDLDLDSLLNRSPNGLEQKLNLKLIRIPLQSNKIFKH